MIYLFIHQSCPGQYVHLIRHLLAEGHRVYFISQRSDQPLPGVHNLYYKPDRTGAGACHPLTVDIDNAIRNAAAVSELCRKLRDEQGVHPDLIVGHGGWGETLFVKDLFPDAPVLTYFEFYYHINGVDVDFDPEFVSVFADADRLRTRNAITLMAAEATDWGHSPTVWQRSLLPPEIRKRVTVVHEGVDTERVCPRADVEFNIPQAGLTLSRADEVITYCARNLEPYRGFHIFMRALPEILRRRPKAQVLIVGGDEVSYGVPPPPGTTYREIMLKEVGSQLDARRVHWFRSLPYEDYLRVLQLSSAHVYLTYPFVLSWSCIEALAAGCLVIGSATPPVLEVIEDGVNGLTVDFFSPGQIAERVDEVFASADRRQDLRDAARQTAIEYFDLKTQALPRWQALLDDLLQGQRPELDP